MATGGHAAGQGGDRAGSSATGTAVLDRPAVDADGGRGGVVQLDEVVLVRRAAVAAAAVGLADDETGTSGVGLRGQCHGQAGHGDAETEGSRESGTGRGPG